MLVNFILSSTYLYIEKKLKQLSLKTENTQKGHAMRKKRFRTNGTGNKKTIQGGTSNPTPDDSNNAQIHFVWRITDEIDVLIVTKFKRMLTHWLIK